MVFTARHKVPSFNDVVNGSTMPSLDEEMKELEHLALPLGKPIPKSTSVPAAINDSGKTAFGRIILEGLLFGAVFAWSDLFKDSFKSLYPGTSMGVVAQLAFALILTGVIVFFAQRLASK